MKFSLRNALVIALTGGCMLAAQDIVYVTSKMNENVEKIDSYQAKAEVIKVSG
ncbi:MAG: hypothetical protein GF401_10045 [Chitinivibrionales bacterium]|nr:hypothetical protein [Chitinivibrionales bacterium]